MILRLAVAALATLLATSPLRAEPPRVVTDIPPVAALVADVAGSRLTPFLILEGPVDPHHAQLRPSAARALAAADLVVWIGPELTPWLARALDALAPEARRLTLLDAPETITRAPLFAEEDDHAHEDEHPHATRDPHAWLDPENAASWLDAIAEALAALDPEAAERYRANARTARQRIARAGELARSRLEPVRAIPLIVQHDAWAHFADRFGLHVAASLADSEATAPGARRFAELRALTSRHGQVCLVGEAPAASPAMRRLAADTSAPLVVADPLGLALSGGPGDYERLILALAEALAGCAAR